jgi:GT2 family glycosyltransferase
METESRKADISFIIPVRNDAARLDRCLKSILNTRTTSTIELIVADNGSTDRSVAVARQYGAMVLILADLTVSELRNRASSAASGGVLAFVDADHEIGPEWIEAALDALRDARVGAVGALYTAPVGSWVQSAYGALRGNTVGRTDAVWLGSGNLVIRRDAFEAVNGFDASLEACEDVDLCQKLRAAEWRVLADERLHSIHFGDPATLGALFRAERWRGRDNLRVTFRGGFTPRQLPSAVIPVAQAVCGLTVIIAVAMLPLIGAKIWPVIMSAACAFLIPSVLRAARMTVTARWRRPSDIWRGAVVAVIYDVARACALLGHAPHHRRFSAS